MNVTEITELLRRQIGLDHGSIGESSIVLAVRMRMSALGLDDPAEYRRRLLENVGEAQELIEEVVVPETWFFRGYHQLSYLLQVFSSWRPAFPGQRFRVLSVPCSSGEEPYSIHMFLRHHGLTPEQFQIVAADISQRALRKAQRGEYSALSFRETDPLCDILRQRFFESSSNPQSGIGNPQSIQVVLREIRESVRFQQDNLTGDGFLAGAAPFDVIFCRNVLIYFDEAARRAALKSLDRLLAPKGTLFAGHAEPIPAFDSRFRGIGPASAFAFQRTETSTSVTTSPRRPIVSSSPRPPTTGKTVASTPASVSSPAKAEAADPPSPEIETRRFASVSAPVAASPDLLASAEAAANAGQLGAARSLCERHVREQGPTAPAYCLMGVICQVAGELSEAEKCFQRALYLDPADHDSLLHLKLLAERRGDRQTAENLRRRLSRVVALGRIIMNAGPDLVVLASDPPLVGDLASPAAFNDCWNRIGVKGDRSCPELTKFVHCRNCPVFSNAGQRLFEREPPAGHLAEWTKRLAEPEVEVAHGTLPVLVFRVAAEWLALDIERLVEIAEPRPIHIIPHRSNQVLRGLVNIRGELDLCISLAGLLGIAFEETSLADAAVGERGVSTPWSSRRTASEQGLHSPRSPGRLMVVSRNGKRWVFEVDAVEGVCRFAPSEMTNVPSTVSRSVGTFSRGVFWRDGRGIGYLDESRLFDTLERSHA